MRLNKEIKESLSKDPVMSDIIQNTALPENRSSGNVYHDLIRSITGQQLSTKVARVIYDRFLSIYDGIEPEPQELLATDHEALRGIGYSNQKAKYVKNVASFFSEHPLDFEYWQKLSDREIMDQLITIKGVGKWTVEMILMFTFERPDVFPIDDLGIQMGMKQLYGLKEEKKELKQKMVNIANQWAPFRTIGSRYIWAARDNTPNK